MTAEYEIMVDPLLKELEAEFDGIHVVAIGGGHGLAQALIAAQDHAAAITAIVSVADDGGSSGRLAPALDIPPPGDIRRCLVALSPEPSLWKRLLEFRFSEGDVAGHSLGNLIIAAMTEMSGGDFQDALNTAGRLLGARGAVVPASLERLGLKAVIGGEAIEGQVAIATTRGGVEQLDVIPENATPSRTALTAIRGADQIVLGPGSLFTSIGAVLRVPGIATAVSESEAQLVYVCNLTTQDGETWGLDGIGHVRALVDVLGIRPPDIVVAHDGDFDCPPEVQPVRLDVDEVRKMGCRVELAELADTSGGWPQHDPARLGAVLRRLA